MTKKIMGVTEVAIAILEKDPPELVVNASGKVNSGGWANGRLVPYIYVMPPADGIYEFDFIADAPTGISTDVIADIKAAPFHWDNFPAELKGVKVYASQNFIISFGEEEKSKKPGRESTSPFNVVSSEALQKLKAENDAFSVTNAFIWEDVLHVSVRYGGGCKKHDFQLVWDGTEMESFPPQIFLFVIHNNNDDACRAIVTEDIQFVLSSHIKTNTDIRLEGWTQKLHYRIS